MAEYRSPGVDVMIERRDVEQQSTETQFYPIFVGTGVTSRNRNIQKQNLRADTSQFPKVTITFDLVGSVNTDMLSRTKFTLGQIVVTKAGTSATAVLEPSTGYTVVEDITFSSVDSTAKYVINIVTASVVSADVIYEINVTASNVDEDFDVKVIGAEDRFYSRSMFGPIVLEENGTEFFNDIAIAAEIAFRMEVPRFYYLEVPRDFGSQPTQLDFQKAVENVYYYNDAYRLVPLSTDPEIAATIRDFVSGVSNPIDRRETVGFVAYDTSNITDMNSINELVEKVGGYSNSLDSKRICNVFAGSSCELRINGQLYELPEYFVPVAVACLDAVVGRVDPISLREIDIFERINGPRFRPKQWDMLAQKGVMIVKKDNDASAAVIRHQLTTSQSGAAEDQEYSVVKNFDVVTKLIRDRFRPYAGQFNIESGYLERLEGTLATVRQEIIEEKLARSLTVLTPWQQSDGTNGRNLVTRVQMTPVYPANNLDIYLIV